MKFLQQHPLQLYVFLPSLHRENTVHYLLLLKEWKDWFEQFNVEIVLIMPDRFDELEGFVSRLHSDWSVHSDPFLLAAKQAGCFHEKPVFGKSLQVVQPSLFLCQNKEVLVCKRQIRTSTLRQLMKKILHIQTKWLDKEIELFCKDQQ